MWKIRRQRISKAAAVPMDMISSLPDNIIILSLFTTKEAVATSILFKRWTHLCHFVPKINLPKIIVNSYESNAVLTNWCSYFPIKALSESEFLCIDAYWFHIEDFVYEVCFIMNMMHDYETPTPHVDGLRCRMFCQCPE